MNPKAEGRNPKEARLPKAEVTHPLVISLEPPT
jgi:hypothetical protein